MSNDQYAGRVAIIGMASRTPGADTPEQLWDNLVQGKNCISTLSDEELLASGASAEEIAHPAYVKAAAPLAGAEAFDASFFYLSGRDAERMDPQLRVFLEGCWEALEHAGYNSENYAGSIGVFAGCLQSTYLLDNLYSVHAAEPGELLHDMQARMGNDPNYLATRVSYHLNLTGPSVAVQSACSTSLLAVHLAAQSLLGHECDMALAGGVSIRFPQKLGYRYQRDGILSVDGQCRPFDSQASGTLFGDGMGVVVLKRLADAVRDRDNVLGVILGSATGNDGSERVGYTAPGGHGQARVIAEALAAAAVEPETISYVEAHGTGTAMGDPIEVSALAQVYSGATPCSLGSLKANLGHLSIAAGVTSLIKTLNMLRHRRIPPQINFSEPNPECRLGETRFHVDVQGRPWTAKGPLRAGISSFGMGGSNVHLVLEEPPPPAPDENAERPLQLLLLSAKSPEALSRARLSAAAALTSGSVSLADAAHTYAMGRRTFNYRCLVVAESTEAASQALEANAASEVPHGSGQPAERPVVFMFPGQGAQHPNMALETYRHEPEFRRAFDACAEIAARRAGLDLRELVHPATPSARPDLNETRFTQPALFAVEYALAKLWASWGIKPAAMIGHSIGEYVAATLAGVLELDAAVALVLERGRLMQECPRGAMLSVLLGPTALGRYLESGISLAAINEPGVCTISGPSDALQRCAARLEADGVGVRPVQTSHAFHSEMMRPAADGMREALRGVVLKRPQVPFISNVTGDWITDEQAVSPDYWADHLLATVRFSDGLSTLFGSPESWVFLECGPGQTLSAFARRHPDREMGSPVLTSLGRPAGKLKEYRALLGALGQLWLGGLSVDHAGFYGSRGRRVPLPTYPFERRPYFVAAERNPQPVRRGAPRKLPLSEWFWVPSWAQQRYVPRQPEAPSPSGQVWLVLTEGDRGERLATALGQAGADVVRVRSGDAFAAEGGQRYRVRPDQKDDFLRLLDDLASVGRLPQRALHAWCIEDLEPGGTPQARFVHEQVRGVYALTAFAQAWVQHRAGAELPLVALTRGAELVTGAEALAAEQTTLALACRVVRQEHPQLDTRHIDFDPTDELAGPPARWAFWPELLEHPSHGLGLAYRHGRRWVESFGRTALAEDGVAGGRLRTGQVVLITGGLGEIGAEIAGMLHDSAQAKLALLTREPLPPENEWPAFAAAHPGPEGALVRRALALRARGVSFVVAASEVSDELSMRRVVARVEAELGIIRGVVHTAGLPGEKWDRTLMAATRETFEWHAVAKAHGTLVLESIFSETGRELDFCLLISSLASVLGGLRLMPYGAANRFMDSVAARVNARSGSFAWLSASWDVWQHHQDEKREKSFVGKSMDDKAIQVQEGLEAIRRLLRSDGIERVAVSTWDMQRRMDQWLNRPRTLT